jgi:hypothetical protein
MSRRMTTEWRAKLALLTSRAIVFTALSAIFIQVAHAAPPADEESDIPKTPTAPPSLLQAIPVDPFHCHRIVVYQGKPIDCDSNVRRDGDNLRRIIKDVPAAIAELDTYQKNRRNLKYTAYAASAGLLVTLVGYFGSRGDHGFRNANSQLTPAAIVALSGLTFSIGSMAFGFYLYESNESHLTEAINDYNLARPNAPIELEFKTGMHF